jgi:hypothetical protein
VTKLFIVHCCGEIKLNNKYIHIQLIVLRSSHQTTVFYSYIYLYLISCCCQQLRTHNFNMVELILKSHIKISTILTCSIYVIFLSFEFWLLLITFFTCQWHHDTVHMCLSQV